MRKLTLALLLPLLLASAAHAQKGGPVAPDGKTEVQIDLPLPLRMFNSGGIGPKGPGTGSGLCVFTSIEMAARYQGEGRLFGLQEKMKHERGGGWPQKVDLVVAKHAPGADYLQVTGCDLAFIRLCLEHGYLVSVTWGGNHMLNVVYLDDRWACILDNNSPYSTKDGKRGGERVDNTLQWMTPAKFQRSAARGGGIWVVVVLHKGPPCPVPCNGGEDLAPVDAMAYRWVWHPGYPRDLYLMDCYDKQVGLYRHHEGKFWYYGPGKGQWAEAEDPPFAPPELPSGGSARVLRSVPDYGVCVEKVGRIGKGFQASRRGKPISRAEAEGLIRRYATALRLTVVGGSPERSAVLQDLDAHAALTAWKGKLLVQDYPEGDVLVAGVGLPAKGLQIVIQDVPGADGRAKVLSRSDSYRGPEALARALEKADALRRPNPAYDPALDTDWSQVPAPKPPPAPEPLPVPQPSPQPEPLVVTVPAAVGEPAAYGAGGGVLGAILGALVTWFVRRRSPTPAPAPAPGPLPVPVPPAAPGQPGLTGRPVIDLILQLLFAKAAEHAESRLDQVAQDLFHQVAGVRAERKSS